MVAPAAAVLDGFSSPAATQVLDAPSPDAGETAGSGALYSGRLADGLESEPASAIVSLLVRLRGDPISSIILDYRARFGDQAAWPAPVVDSARAAIEARDGELGGQRVVVLDALARAGISVQPTRDYRYLVNGINLRGVPSFAATLLAANREVVFVERDHEVFALMAQSVPLINADDVWNLTDGLGRNITGYGALIANIDTGVDYSHPDLGGTLNRTNDLANLTAGTHPKFASGWDFVNNDADPWDGHLHGTHVAGTIGANGTIRGVAPNSKQLALKVLSDAGYGGDSDIIAAMEYATDPDDNALTNDAANASSLSLGGWDPNPDGLEPIAADQSTRLGTICVIAAGNSGATNSVGSPGVSRLAITVGSTTKSDVLSGFSSRGPTLGLDLKPDIVAPGSSITSTRWGGAGGTLTISGTSMATPHVSGAIALIAQAHPNWTVNQTKSALVDTAVDLGYGVYQQGGGRMDVLAAVNTTVVATPYKVVMGRLDRLSNATNATVVLQNMGTAAVTLNLSARDLFGMNPDMTYTGNLADLDFVTVSPTNVTVQAGATATVTLTFSPPGSAVPGLYWGTFTAAGENVLLRIPLAYAVRAPVLVVDDDSSDRYGSPPAFDNFAGFPSACNNVSASLTRLAIKHDIFTAVHYTDDGPKIAHLAQYPLVIWCTGYDYDYSDGYHTHRSISANDRTTLSAYLDRGGQLWLIGENIGWEVSGHTNATFGGSNFFNAYLGVARVDNELNTPDPLTGTPGTFMDGASYAVTPTWTEFGNAGDYATNLTPTARAFTIFNGSTTDVYGTNYPNASLAVAVDNETYRSVFWGVELSFLTSNAAIDDAVSRTMQFFAPRVTLMNASAYEGDLLDFRGYFSFLPNENLFTTAWSFGDGDTESTRNATHSFRDDGTYTVRFTVTSGAWLDRSGTLNLTVANRAPVLWNLTAVPNGALEGDAVGIAGTCTDAGPTDVVSYMIDFGDGSPNATGNAANHTYPNQGNYTVSLACSDGDGGFTVSNITVAIGNAAPVVTSLIVVGVVNEGRPWTFTGACSDSGVLDVVTFTWSFGDGSPDAVGANQTHTYLDNGNFTVTLTCSDGEGGFGSNTTVVPIRNVAPSVTLGAPALILEGDLVSPSSTVTDPGLLDTFSYALDWGDGSPISRGENSTHTYVDNGIYTMRLTVTDDDGGVGLANFTIVVQNVAPTAVFQVGGNMTEGQPFVYNSTLFDPGADTLTVSWTPYEAVTPGGNWAESGPLSFRMIVTDDDGFSTSYLFNITIANANPFFEFLDIDEPAFEGDFMAIRASVFDWGFLDDLNLSVDFGDGTPVESVFMVAPTWWRALSSIGHRYRDEGTYTLTITLADDDGGITTRTQVIAVANAAPTLALPASPMEVDQGQSFWIGAGAADAGVDDLLTVNWSFTGPLPDAAGTGVTIMYPRPGTYYVDVTVTDDSGASAGGFVEIIVRNLAPSMGVEHPAATYEGRAENYTASVSDPGPLDVVEVVWDWGDGSTSAGLSATHTYADVGRYQLTVTASDDYGLSTYFLATIEVQNVAPVIETIVVEGDRVEGATLVFLARITSAPGDVIQLRWDFGSEERLTDGPTTFRFADEGTYYVTLEVVDPEGTVGALSIMLTIENANPALECVLCPESVAAGAPFAIRINATDPGLHDGLTYNLWLPDGGVVASENGTFSLTLHDIGPAELRIEVLDQDGGFANLQVAVNVVRDFDGDTVPDATDLDDDNDGTPDTRDPAPFDPTIREGGAFPWWLLLVLAAGAGGALFLAVRRRRRGGDDWLLVEVGDTGRDRP